MRFLCQRRPATIWWITPKIDGEQIGFAPQRTRLAKPKHIFQVRCGAKLSCSPSISGVIIYIYPQVLINANKELLNKTAKLQVFAQRITLTAVSRIYLRRLSRAS